MISYYDLYRFYSPSLQRWPNRDPLGEPGFELLTRSRSSIRTPAPNLYLFVRNFSPNDYDPLGLQQVPDSNIEECLDNCAEAMKQRSINYAKKTVGKRVIGYIVFSGTAVTGALLCRTPWAIPGAGLVIAAAAGDLIAWTHNTYADNEFNNDNQKQNADCQAACHKKYKQ